MYLPSSFTLIDESLIAQVIEENAFATLVTCGEGGLQASHLPFEYDAERQVLRSHLARANPQWRDFAAGTTLVIFQGPHGYISPRWYETQLAVPTWNYIAIHVSGTLRIIEDDTEVATLLTNLTTRFERDFTPPWSLDAPAEWQQKMRQAIVAFEMSIQKCEAKAKLSQNRPTADIDGAIGGLEELGHNELAAWMRRVNGQKLGKEL